MRPALNRLRRLLPAALTGGRRELLSGMAGACIGMLLTEWLSRQLLGSASPWFLAPLGASAMLLFCVPASPFAQPWSLLGGNLVSALVGVSLHQMLGDGSLTAALAGTLALGAMFGLRCPHPPGVAIALTAVLGGPAVQRLGYAYALAPVTLNSALMLLLTLLFHRLQGRRYPHGPAGAHPHKTRDPLPTRRSGLTREDLDAALHSFDQVLDIDRGDLEEIMVRAQLHSQRRQWGEVRCADIMSRDVVSVAAADSVDEAWSRLERHRIKALPVVDVQGQLTGIVSLHDFFIGQSAPAPTRVPRMSTARRVEEIMTRRVRSARPDQSIADLVRGFSDGGLHHMPVVDEANRVVGMITQSDLVGALFHAMAARN
ncbi:MAG: hypothetical protein RJA36_1701 [Pseudomonadota bacterium]|jgi:CBS domain-containing membrane protein